MENKIVQFEFVDCSTVVSEFSDEDNNSSGLDSKEQAIDRPYMLDLSDIIMKQVPLVKTEPGEQPEVKKTEPSEHPVVKDESIEKKQLVVKAETIEEPVNLNQDNNSSGLDSKEQAIDRPYMLDLSDIIMKQVPLVKTEPSEQPEVKTEPSEHPVVKDESIEKKQLVVKAETIEEPVNLNQVYGNPLSNTFVGELEELQMIRNKRRSLMNDRQGTVIRNIVGNIRREWRNPQGVNAERPIRPKCKSARDCRNLITEQYILCKKLVLEDAQHCTIKSKSSRCNSSLSSQTSISELSSDCESDSKYRIKRNRNNLASKLSREKRKNTIKRLQHELEELNEKNRNLRAELDSLVKILNDLNTLLLHCEQIRKG